jgi:hypothetical protein
MSPNDYGAAEKAAQKLSQYDEDRLLFELGKRIEDSKQPGGEQRKGEYEAAFIDTSGTQGFEFLEEVGRRWYRNAEAELMRFLCDKKNTDRDSLTSGKSIPQIAASLATAGLLAVIAAPPAWVIVATTIVAQKLTSTGLDAWCHVYYERQKKASGQT